VIHEDNTWGITLEEDSSSFQNTNANTNTNENSSLPKGLKYSFDQPTEIKVSNMRLFIINIYYIVSYSSSDI
jgi:hypothetical protein